MQVRQMGRVAMRGTLATGAMSLFMWAAWRSHLLGSPPPRKLTERFLRLWTPAPHSASVFSLTGLSHVGFGVLAAIPFSYLASRFRTKAARIAAGGVYGGAVWAAMYQGALPALELMPKPRRDRPGRPTSMLIAHLIYGGTLGALFGERNFRDPRSAKPRRGISPDVESK
jgi:hypothetical protein